MTNAQKAARRRRKDRQRQLMEVGKKASDVVAKAEQQVQVTGSRLAQLEAEVVSAHKDLGIATDELALARVELQTKIVLLGGLEDELKTASETVRSLETERDEIKKQLRAACTELDAVKKADSDTKSLRNRLQRKSEEIVQMGTKVREMRSFLDAKRLLKTFDDHHSGAETASGDVGTE